MLAERWKAATSEWVFADDIADSPSPGHQLSTHTYLTRLGGNRSRCVYNNEAGRPLQLLARQSSWRSTDLRSPTKRRWKHQSVATSYVFRYSGFAIEVCSS
jgi:hypothetical protein